MGYEGATNYIRIRGLPWQSSREDVLAFFEGIVLCTDDDFYIMTVFIFCRDNICFSL